MSVYAAKHRTQKIEEECRRTIEKSVDILVKIKDLQAELYDCESFDEEPDWSVKDACGHFLHNIELLKSHIIIIESQTTELFDQLGFSVIWDDKREEWYLEENFDEE